MGSFGEQEWGGLGVAAWRGRHLRSGLVAGGAEGTVCPVVQEWPVLSLSPLGLPLSPRIDAAPQACSVCGLSVCAFTHSLLHSIIYSLACSFTHPFSKGLLSASSVLSSVPVLGAPSEADGHGPHPHGASGQVQTKPTQCEGHCKGQGDRLGAPSWDLGHPGGPPG